VDTFVPDGSAETFEDLAFGPDGKLYVSAPGLSSDKVTRYDGTSGAYLGDFIVGGGLKPYGLGFGADGNLYVCNDTADTVGRYYGTDGAFLDTFASAANDPSFLTFSPVTPSNQPPQITCAKVDEVDGCVHTRTITYTAVSVYGATNTCTQLVQWTTDTTPPVLVNYPIGGDVGCNPTNPPTDEFVQSLSAGTDNCGTPIVLVSHMDNVSSCGVSRTFTIQAQDTCQNLSSPTYVTFTWTVDTMPPMVTAGGIASCYFSVATAEAAAIAATSASDTCSSIQKTASTTGTCNAVVTVTATDACGNSASVNYNTRIVSIAPVFTSVPADTDLGCNPTVPTDTQIRAVIGATNACGVAFTNVTYLDGSGALPCVHTRVFTITVGGECGPVAETNVTYTWTQDTQGPNLTCAPGKTVVCGSVWSFDPPQVTDACGGTNVLTVLSTATNSAGPYTIATRTWQATDTCGNVSTCSQVVTQVTYIVNTGAAANGTLLTPGTPEPVFVNIGSPVGTNAMVTMNMAQIPRVWSQANGRSQWVGPIVSGSGPSGWYTNRWQFFLACPNASLIGLLSTDDEGYLFLNGADISPLGGYGFGFGLVNHAGGFVTGLNTVDVVVHNGGGNTGFRAEFQVASDCGSLLVCATNKSVACGSSWDFDPPQVFARCCAAGPVVAVLNTVTNGACPQQITRTWVVTDCLGASNMCSQTVSIFGPTAPPDIAGIKYAPDGVHITVPTLPCFVYVLECKQGLLDPNWITCQTTSGTGANHDFVDQVQMPPPTVRLYRVKLMCP